MKKLENQKIKESQIYKNNNKNIQEKYTKLKNILKNK